MKRAPGLDDYVEVVGPYVLRQVRGLAARLAGANILHVNATRQGGGVAEILARLVPLLNELGLETRWEVLAGDDAFFATTKKIHNALQGNRVEIGPKEWAHYEEVNAANATRINLDADFVFVHDPQPASLLAARNGSTRTFRPGAKWVWRCHIDVSHPHRPVWRYLSERLQPYHASVFSMPQFARALPHPQFLVAPAIDPLSDKNCPLPEEELEAVWGCFGLDRTRPVLLQVSRFDRFKDPGGVVQAYRLVKRHLDVQLVLAGGTADDDPEGAGVLAEVREAAAGDPDVHILLLPPDAHRTINALQRAATIIFQKSTREGFGLTVTEALWKGKPVIGGATGGIALQVVDYHTGFLVHTVEGAAYRARYLLRHHREAERMGRTGREHVRSNFLLLRQLREYLTLLLALRQPEASVLEV